MKRIVEITITAALAFFILCVLGRFLEGSWAKGGLVASNLFFGGGGLILVFLGISSLIKASEKFEYIDNDMGSVERTVEGRKTQALEGAMELAAGIVALVICWLINR